MIDNLTQNEAGLSAQRKLEPQSPIKAIRAHCVTCSGDSPDEANKCTATGCPLWAYRMGRNPFHAGPKQNGGAQDIGGPS